MPGMFDSPMKKKAKRVPKKSAVAAKTKELKFVKTALNASRKKIVRVKKFIDKVL